MQLFLGLAPSIHISSGLQGWWHPRISRVNEPFQSRLPAYRPPQPFKSLTMGRCAQSVQALVCLIFATFLLLQEYSRSRIRNTAQQTELLTPNAKPILIRLGSRPQTDATRAP